MNTIPPDVLWPSIALMVFGVLGCFVPLLPGPPLVFVGAAYFAWRTGFTLVGVPTLVLLGVIAFLGATSNLWLGFLGAKKGGASGWSSLAAVLGSILGLMVFSVPGAILGAIGAIIAVEYGRHRDWNAVWRASGGYVAGYLLSMVVEFCACLSMVGFFLLDWWL